MGLGMLLSFTYIFEPLRDTVDATFTNFEAGGCHTLC